MTPRRMLSAPLAAFITLCLTASVHSAETAAIAPDAPPVVTEAAETPPEAAPRVRPVRKLTPLRLAIRNVLEEERAAALQLRTRIRAAAAPEQAIALQRELAELKQATEAKVIRLQLEDARTHGRLAEVARHERSLAEMEAARAAELAARAPASLVRTTSR